MHAHFIIFRTLAFIETSESNEIILKTMKMSKIFFLKNANCTKYILFFNTEQQQIVIVPKSFLDRAQWPKV